MPEKRYHIHVICSPDDQVEMLDGLAIFMEKRAFLTRDLMQGDNESAGYSRRCIDACDYLIMVVGDSYGKLNNTGVSQLHLSYIYAKTKAKPIVIFLKLHQDNATLSRQLADFTRMIEQQNSGSIYYYDEDVCVQEFLAPVYRKFIREHKSSGWRKVISKQNGLTAKGQNKASSIHINSVKPLTSNALTSNASVTVGSLKKDPINEDLLDKNKQFKRIDAGLPIANDSVSLDIEIIVNFTTHAYEEGNLSDINLLASLTWRQVLQVIVDKPMPLPFISFQRAINELVQTMALPIAQQEVSAKIHAVSRTQVSMQDIRWLVAQMLEFGWMTQVGVTGNTSTSAKSHTKITQELLQLTALGKQKLTIG